MSLIYRNFSECLMFIAEEIGAFGLVSTYYEDDKEVKELIVIKKDGFFKQNSLVKMRDTQVNNFLRGNYHSVMNQTAGILKKKNVFLKYLPCITLATFCDDLASYTGQGQLGPAPFFYVENGIHYQLNIVSTEQTGAMIDVNKTDISIDVARDIFRKNHLSFCLQLNKALANAKLAGRGDDEKIQAQKRKEREELGIKATKMSNGQIRISAGDILNQKKGQSLTEEKRAEIKSIKDSILKRPK